MQNNFAALWQSFIWPIVVFVFFRLLKFLLLQCSLKFFASERRISKQKDLDKNNHKPPFRIHAIACLFWGCLFLPAKHCFFLLMFWVMFGWRLGVVFCTCCVLFLSLFVFLVHGIGVVELLFEQQRTTKTSFKFLLCFLYFRRFLYNIVFVFFSTPSPFKSISCFHILLKMLLFYFFSHFCHVLAPVQALKGGYNIPVAGGFKKYPPLPSEMPSSQ